MLIKNLIKFLLKKQVMSIFNFLNFSTNLKHDNSQIPSPFKRSNAGIIDIIIVMILRATFLIINHALWFFDSIIKFKTEFNDKYGTETPKRTIEHMEFIKNHEFFSHVLLLFFSTILVGAIYHAYFNSSKWQATIGKRIFKIKIQDKNGYPISFMDGIYHYLLSLIPYIFVIVVVIYSLKNNIEIYRVFSSSIFMLITGILILVASHLNNFNKYRINFFDYIMDFRFIIDRTTNKFPWSKD